MRVVTCNLHAGVDGWGRATSVLETVRRLDADLLILPETWRADRGEDQFATLCDEGHYQGHFVALSPGERTVDGPLRRRWQPLLAHFTGERGLYFTQYRRLSGAQRRARAATTQETGRWGISLLARAPLTHVEVLEMGRLPRERVTRRILVADLTVDGHDLRVVALHGAHLSHGSPLLYWRVRRLLATRRDRPILLAGDFNAWTPLVRLFFPGWRHLARARTWPARHPHSQIDHVLGRGPWRVGTSFAVDGGSDHRALVADCTLD